MKRESVVICTLFIFLVLLSCSQDETYTIEIKDGVRHVHNHAPLWGDEPKVALEFVQKIGVTEGEDENYMFFLPLDIAKDAEGNVYVLDAGNYRIQKFDKNGKYLTTIGRKGEGPGEFMGPKKVCIDSNGTIYVFDFNRIKVFSYDGKEENIIHCPLSSSFNMQILQPDEHNTQKMFLLDAYFQGGSNSYLLTMINEDGKIVKNFGKKSHYDNLGLKRQANRITFEVSSNNNIVVVFQHENRIDKYASDGTLIFSADRDLRYKINNRVEKYEIDSHGTVEELEISVMAYVSSDVGLDYKSRIWIPTYKNQPPIRTHMLGDKETSLKIPYDKNKSPDEEFDYVKNVELEIYDKDGILLGRHPLPFLCSILGIIGDRIYFSNLNDMCVYEYKIIEK